MMEEATDSTPTPAAVACKLSAMVRIYGPDPKETLSKGRAFFDACDGISVLSASGCVAGGDSSCVRIITSASLLVPFFAQGCTLEALQLLPQTGLDVMLEDQGDAMLEGAPTGTGRPSAQGHWMSAELTCIIPVPAAAQALSTLLGVGCGGWDYVGNPLSFGAEALGLNMWELYTSLAVLTVHQPLQPPRIPPQLRGRELCRGDPLWVAASPFGLVAPSVFRASVSQGIVANLVPYWPARPPSGNVPALLVTDARGLAGSEGGVVVGAQGHLVALMAPPLQRTDGTTSTLSVCITLNAITAALDEAPLAPRSPRSHGMLNVLEAHHKASAGIQEAGRLLMRPDPCMAPTTGPIQGPAQEGAQEGAQEAAQEAAQERVQEGVQEGTPHTVSTAQQAVVQAASLAVVAVRVGSLWGSGILVSASGHVLTNAHILRSSVDNKTKLLVRGSNLRVCIADEWYAADLVLISDGVMDIAVLQALHVSCPVSFLPIDPLRRAFQGQQVLAVGHALFAPSYGLVESVTRGVVSRVVSLSKCGPVMIQSSVAIHQGNSGGALICARTGVLLGLVTSNARHISGRIIPSLNFSLPVNMLGGVNRFLEDPEDSTGLQMLHMKDPDVFDIWNLEPPLFDIRIDSGDAPPLPGMHSKL